VKQPTSTLTAAAPSITLTIATTLESLLTEDGEPILTEDGEPITVGTRTPRVALVVDSPTVTLALRRNA
jgi:hypothetical protein